MARRIAIIQDHLDPRGTTSGTPWRRLTRKAPPRPGTRCGASRLAQLDFQLLRTTEDFEQGTPPESIRKAQEAIRWVDHLVILYALWMGGMPALLTAFLEQVFWHGFAMTVEGQTWPKKLLKGRSARIVVTMGMPAFFYRWYFGAHSLKSLRRNILGFSGIGPIRTNLIGMVEGSAAKRQQWLETMRPLGQGGR